ncbi:hypothetical protein G6F56_009668 [Rhizopus delemar]|nr:hypothetical protein G6F56_009668 [Rhizopus delemar]
MHAKGRVPIENAFGILKEVFQSLKCLRHVITGKSSVKYLSIWIRVCMVLHNIMIDNKDPYITIMEKVYVENRKNQQEKTLKASLPKSLKSEKAENNIPENLELNNNEEIRQYFHFETGQQKRQRLMNHFVLPKHRLFYPGRNT